MDDALRALLARHRGAEVDAGHAAYDAVPADRTDKWGNLASWRRGVGSLVTVLPAVDCEI